MLESTSTRPIRARVEAETGNQSTEIDLQMTSLDEFHQQHVESRLRECFTELWGVEVIITFHEERFTYP